MSLYEIYKAKKLGYADDYWTSAIGHSLGGYKWISTDYEQTPYIYRAMPNMSHYYNREIMDAIVGGSMAWNQLCNGSSVTVQNGHKYFLKKGSAESVATSAGSAITGLTSGSDMVTDLTLALGSTIADYIYSLEQATAGTGVAFFKSLFPKPYYAYDAGSIQSVSGLVSHTTKDANDNVIGSYPLDSTLTLRGIPKLDNGKLYYDGDEYSADGGISRKYGIVDLGTLNWDYTSGTNSRMTATLDSIKTASASNVKGNMVCDKYVTATVNDVYMHTSDKLIGVHNAFHQLWVYDSAYTSAAAFKTAVSGVYLVYEVATPTTETATPFTKTQNCDSGGTEEFVTSGIVSVGHKSKYAEK